MKPPPPWSTELRSAAVTGTNGKSSTVWMLARMLSHLVGPVPSACTLGNYLGTQPLPYALDYHGFLQTMRDGWQSGARHAAVEVTSQALAQGMARAWPFSIAIFTNLTHDHLDAHRTPEHYLASKAQLFMALPRDGVAILNADDPASTLLEEVIPRHASIVKIGRTAPQPLALRLEFGSVTTQGTAFTVCKGTTKWPATTRLIGEIFAQNALGALAAGQAMGFDLAVLIDALAKVEPTPGRFTLVNPDSDQALVAIDYAHTPDALHHTLITAKSLAQNRNTPRGESRIWLIFGAGGNRDRSKRPAMGAAACRADHVILTNDNPRDEDPSIIFCDLKSGMASHPHVEIIADRREALAFALHHANSGDLIVVAGKGHESTQIHGSLQQPRSDYAMATELLGLYHQVEPR